MVVVDASVLVEALTDDGERGARSADELSADLHWAGPEHLVIETFSAIRSRAARGEIGGSRGRSAVEALSVVRIETFATGPLLPRLWELRENVSGYDAAYIAVAELNGCPLVTADARLARVPGLRCPVVVV